MPAPSFAFDADAQTELSEHDAETTRPPSCPPPTFVVPANDTTLTTLDAICSDHMDRRHYVALATHMKKRERADDDAREQARRACETAVSGVRAKLASR